MLAIKLRTNLAEFRKGLSAAHQRQVPFAVVSAVNAIATGVQADIVASMKTTFDRPTPFTLRATYVKKARKADMTAFVGIREFAPKGTPAWKYLGPQVEGGPRRQKAFERRLSQLNGAAPYALPGPGATLDAFGNMSRGQIVKILSGVGALGDQSTTPKSARRGKGGLIHHASRGQQSSFFIGKSKAGKPTGVYQLKSKGHVVQVLRFSDKAPAYNAIWPINDIVLSSVRKHRVGAFERGWALALSTAKP